MRDGIIESDQRTREPARVLDAAEQRSGRPSLLRSRLRDLRVGLKSLSMHPLRSMLTVLGIFIGVG